ncbi:MAG: YbhB/YbcL family Raf kinase inhibitor-like protein [Alphaproteobacteria bacterium]|nr:YbhB/YbcL family Raf kinase inhibitor-like protein [Alphaproteobacteria bacterium]MBL7097427.1 YbhB/YbcL family Raf kinase inhibitor-like protein [Alphaproteobacteria bacterium]
MTITSSDFKDGAALPTAHIYPRCGGLNVSPELTWSGAPQGTGELILTVIDVSVKPNGWSHWIVVNLPTAMTSLAHGLKTLPSPAEPVASNFGDKFYDGPCPPPGTGTHRYEFTIWAIPRNAMVPIQPDMAANDLLKMLAGAASAHATIAATVTAK